ncbi:MAG: chemotaxis protein CheB [Gemmatimonadota bacterium]|nr:chemotaxis protein CheB [Gemmatimonadota bacterium]
MSNIAIAVVGASWGGLAAISQLLAALPAGFAIPLAVVQHRSRHADNLLAALLQDITALRVVDVEDKEPLEPGSVYIAPANYHMLVENGHLSLSTDPQVRFSRPSIDVTFISAADTYQSKTLGIVLTGANDDGARGLEHIVKLGGRAIVQDPATAESPTMPSAARNAVPEAEVLDLSEIPARLIALSRATLRVKPGKSDPYAPRETST